MQNKLENRILFAVSALGFFIKKIWDEKNKKNID